MEGGGQSRDSKAALRIGMDGFLAEIKDVFRACLPIDLEISFLARSR